MLGICIKGSGSDERMGSVAVYDYDRAGYEPMSSVHTPVYLGNWVAGLMKKPGVKIPGSSGTSVTDVVDLFVTDVPVRTRPIYTYVLGPVLQNLNCGV